ncbi:MAG: DUF3048 domain-containing protein [Chloroflexi bacterium]|nr:DUF3048 domain-containing protein [Chloroflexota bacterium]
MKKLLLLMMLLLTACVTFQDQSPLITEVVKFDLPPATVVPTKLPTATPTNLPLPSPTALPTITPTPSIIDSYPEDGYGPLGFPSHINPLTGLPVENPDLLERRPVAVKISNGPRSVRPQWGLSLADHVFEYYQEAGRTRFNAIFYGQDAELAGPIRSARFTDEHIIRSYKAVFAYGSADYRVLWRLLNTDFWNRMYSVTDFPCPPTAQFPTCRTDPNGWNHLMTDTAALSQYFSDKGIGNGRQFLEGLAFNFTPPADGTLGKQITLRYSQSHYNKWEYQPESGRYIRYQDSVNDLNGGQDEAFELLTDQLNDRIIAADNVVVLLADHSYFSRTPEMLEINLLGYGSAYLFRDGQAYLIDWGRPTIEDLIYLTYPDGSRFPLKPGTTWFQILGSSSLLSVNESDWRFEYRTP